MAMFGGLAKKRSPFDFTPPIYSTPGIGDGLPGAKSMGDPGLGMAVGAAPQQKGGGWRDVLGVISEGLAGAAGNGPGVYMQSKMRDKEMQRQDSLYQRHRADQMVDWRAKQEFERSNPAPRAPHYWEMNDGSLGVVGPDGKPTILFKDPTPKINWIKADNGDGTQQLIPVGPNGPISPEGGDPVSSGGAGGVARPSPSAIEPDIILNRARQQGYISPEDRASIERHLGPNGRTALDGWLASSKVKTGQKVGGKMYYQVNGKWYDNPEGR